MTKDQKVALVERLEAKAAEYAEVPQKGLTAGYRPEQVQGWGAAALGQPRQRINMRSLNEAWLYGVVRKDMPPGIDWQIARATGDGPGSAFLIIR